MKKLWLLVGLLLVSSIAYAAGGLLEEFRRRENTRLTQEQGDAINFLRIMNYDIKRIEEIEMLDGGRRFVIRDRENIVCFGDLDTRIIRCKNKIGLTTVTLDGDAD
ncbi:MAG: hypothetical protein M9962_08705 [Oligoflexia bacterium]|nr:hypothetical protein [Oligoflexia bacterium]